MKSRFIRLPRGGTKQGNQQNIGLNTANEPRLGLTADSNGAAGGARLRHEHYGPRIPVALAWDNLKGGGKYKSPGASRKKRGRRQPSTGCGTEKFKFWKEYFQRGPVWTAMGAHRRPEAGDVKQLETERTGSRR